MALDLALVAGDGARAREASASVPPEDLRDVKRSLEGDGEAYRRLIERHQQQVGSIMWRFSRDPEIHEELTQEAFIQAYESLANYRAQAPFAHWLSRIATRVGYAYWKKKKREQRIETVPLEEWHHIPDAESEAPGDLDPAEAAEALHGLLGQLPPRDRLILTLRYVEEKSVEEAAEQTGWSQTMVKVQSWRARKKLRALYEQAMGEADS